MRNARWKTIIGIGFAAILASNFLVARAQSSENETARGTRPERRTSFDLEVLVDGRPVSEYYSRGRTYVEALNGAEYELRSRNPFPERVAVALSVDGLNTIDARHTSAWNASKWVIEPYGSITIAGWQMSSERARHFYFTTERDSYAAKLGQSANLGVISAAIFRGDVEFHAGCAASQTSRGRKQRTGRCAEISSSRQLQRQTR
jgi:hypothetical protein